jgi:predicted RNase H-like HicB family nuclease
MTINLNLTIEKIHNGYRIISPELNNRQWQGDSFEKAFDELKQTLKEHLEETENSHKPTTGQSLLKLGAKFRENLSDEELDKIPHDGAQQHDHYLYKTPKNS